GPAGSNVLYEEGVFGQAARVPADLSLTYPVSGNLDLESGGLSFWAKIPETYPENGTGRHYLLAASDNPGDSARGVYTGTLALRRETVDGAARWNFWTVADGGERQDLVVADTFGAGWHHFALLWDRHAGEGGAAKQLYIDGELAAEQTGVPWPASVGERLEIGRWTPGYGVSGVAMDELALFGRVLAPDEVGRLAAKQDYFTSEPGPLGMRSVTGERAVVLDTNGIDRQGGIVGVRLRRNDEPWSQPLPFYDSYRWQITGTDDVHTFSVEYRDRANNVSVVTATVTLGSMPSGQVRLEQLEGVDSYYRYQALEQFESDLGAPSRTQANGTGVRLHLTPVGEVPAAFQVATSPDFVRAEWRPFVDVLDWTWADGEPRVAYVRFRSRDGVIGPAIMVGNDLQRHYLPLIGN
ncbi:MAG TPA: LamG-like jellyroll fold domain-containing protein, partial [Herpetosiphonaceae bacterium]|nr:LamG-like jellyroll fold domain-containing protein [Herpetosiphonaceae bacterium]